MRVTCLPIGKVSCFFQGTPNNCRNGLQAYLIPIAIRRQLRKNKQERAEVNDLFCQCPIAILKVPSFIPIA
jgi:hypothetical protein